MTTRILSDSSRPGPLRSVWSVVLGLGVALLGFCPAAVLGQLSYTIDWLSIDAGGGTSTNGDYTVTGTVGQPDAGRAMAGSYALEAGFWSILPQFLPEPLLIELVANCTILVSWPATMPAGGLEQTLSLDHAVWSPVTNPVVRMGNRLQTIITIPSEDGACFYRFKPNE